MKRIIKFKCDCGRGGSIEGLSVYTEEEYNTLISAIDNKQTFYFGEVLGKHSDVYGEIEESDIYILSDDQPFIEQFEQLMGSHVSGICILDYLACAVCDQVECQCEGDE